MQNRSPFLVLATLFALGAASLQAGCDNGTPSCANGVPNTICTIAGNGKSGAGGDNGPATSASLYTPQDTAVGPDGSVWLLDFNNYLVRAVDPNGVIQTMVGIGFLGDSPEPGMPTCPALTASFNHTPAMVFHDGYLYLAAWHNSRVKRVQLSNMMLENYAGVGKRTVYTGDDGPALGAALDLPSSLAFDPSGELVIMDQANQVIRKVDAAGNIHRIAGTCEVERYSFETPVCAKGTTLTQCPNSNKATYCTDTMMACSWPCTPSYAGDGGPALAMRMAQPFGQAADPAGRMVYDKAGNLIFADTLNNRIRKIDLAGNVSTIAGLGGSDVTYGLVGNVPNYPPSGSYSGDGGPATDAQLNHPIDVAMGDDGTLYFTDTNNNCIRKVDTSGIISTVAGDCSTSGKCGGTGECFAASGATSCNTDNEAHCFAGDGGPPEKALLNRPYGIDVVGKKLYIADSYNNRIRLVNLP